MKKLAIILNVCLIGIILFAIISKSHMRGLDYLLALLLLLYPSINILVINNSGKESLLDNSLLFLYIKRRVMEEKKKIEELK